MTVSKMPARGLAEPEETEPLEVELKSVAGKTFLMASPSVGQVSPVAARHLRMAMMHLGNNGGKWAADVSSGRGSVMAARNFSIDSFFELSAIYRKEGNGVKIDGMFWVDDDILMPMHALTTMAAVDKDFVTGVYCQRAGDMLPLVGKFTQRGRKKGFRWAVNLPEDAIMSADGCGFGIVYTSARMLRKLGRGAFNHRDNLSEDLSFCMRAKEAGFQLYCLTALKCGHLGEQSVITYDSFKQHWAKNPSKEKVELVTADGADSAA